MTTKVPKPGIFAWTGTAHETVMVTLTLGEGTIELKFPSGKPVRVTDEVYNKLLGRTLLIRWERTR